MCRARAREGAGGFWDGAATFEVFILGSYCRLIDF